MLRYANLMKTHKTYSDEISITDLQEDLISPTPPLCRPVRIADASMLRDQCPKMSVPTIPDICVRHALCIVFPMPSRLRHCL